MMTVTAVEKDVDNLTMTLLADFDAPVQRVWQLWADPRQLERWWGPPTYPATVEKHELTQGGTVTYYMTGPDGDQSRGWWRITSVDPPTSLEFVDGFADEHGQPVGEMPTQTIRVRLLESGAGTRMELRSTFESAEKMEQMLAMGMEEGLRAAVGQIESIMDLGT